MKKEELPFAQEQYEVIDKKYTHNVFLTKTIPLLRTIGLFIWSVLDLLLVCGATLFLIWYLVQGVFLEKRLVARIGENINHQRQVMLSQQAQGLAVSRTQVFSGNTGQYDLYATIGNPNPTWFATFAYYFETSAGKTSVKKGFVLPGDTQIIAELSQRLESYPSGAELIVENIEWQRIRGKGDLNTWLEEHDAFEMTNVKHGFITRIGDKDVVQTAFSITNHSPYSYWDVDTMIVLRIGQSVVGVNAIRIPYIASGEKIERTVNWFWNAPAGAVADIVPQINFFDEDVYKENPNKPVDESLERL